MTKTPAPSTTARSPASSKGSGSRATDILKNIWRLFANEPPDYIFGQSKILGEERIQVKADLAHFLALDDSRPIFLIGAWGSGKTTFVRSLETEFEKRFRYVYRSLFAVSTTNEAYLALLPRLVWISTSLLAFVTLAALWHLGANCPQLSPHKELIAFAAAGAGFFFVSNKMKVLYIVASILNFSFGKKPHLTVIDDLERSSLNSAETWAIFSNLWTENHKYLVLLGYNSDEDKLEIIERAIKLGGHLVFLPTDYNVNFKIIAPKLISV